MNIKELVASLKEKGVSDEDIKAQLEAIKKEIDEFLSPAAAEDENIDNAEEETEDAKMKRVFGV